MGLDMYVVGKRFLWDFNDDSQIIESVSKLFPEIGNNRVKQIEAEFMYWRKANAIHKWFVDNVQEGNDDCGEYYLTEENLVSLRDTCRAVLEDRSQAATLLPAQGGFFFGNTDYDDGYFDDVERTLDWLNTILFVNKFDTKLQNWTLYYQSSW